MTQAMIKAAAQDFQHRLLAVYSDREAWYITHLVFEQVTGFTRLDIMTKPESLLSEEQQQEIAHKLAQLVQNMPVQYVLHECFFYHLPLYVDENVLIPRPETEELVEWIIKTRQARPQSYDGESPAAILDVGTGSGCIAIALKKNIPDINMLAVDNSAGALEVARENAGRNKVTVRLIQADVMENGWIERLPVLDAIVSNPPYIPASERASMQERVTAFEPGQALFVPDEDPLIYYKCIINIAGQKLKPDGDLFFEIHEDFAQALMDLLEEKGFSSELKKDMSGRDRMVRAGRISPAG